MASRQDLEPSTLFNSEKGFGFKNFEEGQTVEYKLEAGAKGPQATEIQVR
nr:cold shock domain-containing protein [Glutamicibacter soli]